MTKGARRWALRAFVSRQLEFLLDKGHSPRSAVQTMQRSVDSGSLAMVKHFSRVLRDGDPHGLFEVADPTYKTLRHVLVASGGNPSKLVAAFGSVYDDILLDVAQFRKTFVSLLQRWIVVYILAFLMAWGAQNFVIPLLVIDESLVTSELGSWANIGVDIWLLNQLFIGAGVLLLLAYLDFRHLYRCIESFKPVAANPLSQVFRGAHLREYYHNFLLAAYVDILRRSDLNAEQALGQATALVHNLSGTGGQATALEKVDGQRGQTISNLKAALKMQSLDRELPYQTDQSRRDFDGCMEIYTRRLLWPAGFALCCSFLLSLLCLLLPVLASTTRLLHAS